METVSTPIEEAKGDGMEDENFHISLDDHSREGRDPDHHSREARDPDCHSREARDSDDHSSEMVRGPVEVYVQMKPEERGNADPNAEDAGGYTNKDARSSKEMYSADATSQELNLTSDNVTSSQENARPVKMAPGGGSKNGAKRSYQAPSDYRLSHNSR